MAPPAEMWSDAEKQQQETESQIAKTVLSQLNEGLRGAGRWIFLV